jgi:hypothetical protein
VLTRLAPALLGLGYAASLAVLVRFRAVVRERRWRWLALHHLGVLAIVAGWWGRRQPWAAAVNACWLVAASAWYSYRGRDDGPQSGGGRRRSG